jgi:hypothetical protein
MTHPASHPAVAGTPASQASITIRDGAGPYGRDLSFPQAISQLRDGEQITVVPVGTSAAGGDPRGEPVFGFDVTVYPARTGLRRDEPLKVSWGSKGTVPAADAALFAETLTLASRLALYAGLSDSAPPAPDPARDAAAFARQPCEARQLGRRDPS